MRARPPHRWHLGLAALLTTCAACDRSAPVDDKNVEAAARDIELPRVRTNSELTAPGAIVVVSKTRVTIAGDRYPIATVPSDPQRGLSADDKPGGRRDLIVTPLAHALWGISASATPPTKEAPRLVLVADKHTPYRVLLEIATTARIADVTSVSIAARQPSGLGSVRVMAAIGKDIRHRPDALALVVTARDEGFDLESRDRHIGPGCIDVGRGQTVPKTDIGALVTCLKTLKGAAPEYADETALTFAAPDGAELESVLDVVTAVARTPEGAVLFPEVTLALIREGPPAKGAAK